MTEQGNDFFAAETSYRAGKTTLGKRSGAKKKANKKVLKDFFYFFFKLTTVLHLHRGDNSLWASS